MAKIDINDVYLEYDSGSGRQAALDGVSFSVGEGEFVSVIGSSGCGKSTLLGLLAGLMPPSGGEILIDGDRVTGTGKDRSVVFQHYSLFPWMSARGNIVFALKQQGRNGCKPSALREKADRYLGLVGLADAARKFPRELSGGMQQRVAIARALALDSPMLLMDEPFGAIDAKNRAGLQELLLDLWDCGDGRKTVVFVTHDIDEAIFLSDKIVVMSSGPGRVKEEIPVPFPRPREREGIVRTAAYAALRNRIVLLFYDDLAKAIGGEEVVI
ncbi:MAG: ABC transporter ATP-binding protein [Clostridiales Family XIII bacterium]|nr:ABC transporter ATP-binding protein [Clostridiales Family XIII bacterium]